MKKNMVTLKICKKKMYFLFLLHNISKYIFGHF